MIGTFLKERLSWIGFVFFIHGVILLVGTWILRCLLEVFSIHCC